MNRRHLLAAVAAILATPLLAQTAPAPPTPAAADLVKVALDTEAGRIVLDGHVSMERMFCSNANSANESDVKA